MTIDPGQQRLTISERVAAEPLESVGSYCYGCLESNVGAYLDGHIDRGALRDALDELAVAWLNRIRPLDATPPPVAVEGSSEGSAP